MVTNITAVPLSTGFLFDKAPLLGIPVWAYIGLALVLIFIILNLWWLFRRLGMRAVLGYLDVLRKGGTDDVQVWMVNKNKVFYIQSLKYLDGILFYTGHVLKSSKWLLTSAFGVGRAGGIPALMVRDNYDCAIDPVAELALCTMADEVNREKKLGNPEGSELIKNYSDYEKYRDALEKLYPEGVEIPSYGLYDPSKVNKYLPLHRASGFFGEMIIEDARDTGIPQPELSAWLKFAPIGAAVAIGAIAIIMTYVFCTGKFI